MFEQIVNSLPPDPHGVIITLLVCAGIGIGALTALLGALHSRPTMALMMLSLGALLGQAAPRLTGWSLHAPALITIGAIVFGLLGYLLHRYIIALSLGALLAVASIAILHDQIPHPVEEPPAIQVELHTPAPVAAPSAAAAKPSLPPAAPSATWWDNAPQRFRTLAPWVAIGVFLVTTAVGFLFPKVGMAALYSIAGTALLLFSIALGHASDKISWLDSIKAGPMTIGVLGLALLLLGFITQIVLLNRPVHEAPSPRREKADAYA